MTNGLMKNDERAVLMLRKLYRQYGYSQYKMSRFEEYELYVRSKDFLVSDEVITFTDSSGRLLALKPDVTLSIIKNAAFRPGTVQKVYYNENVYRIARGTHTFKEIMQTGLECVGDIGAYEIAEVVLLAAKSLEQISEDSLLDLSHMGLIAAVLNGSGLSADGREKALTCLSEKNAHELLECCEAEGVDSAKLTALIDCCGPAREALAALRPYLTEDAELTAFTAFADLCGILEQNGFGERIRVDFSVGNDMKYYSGVVFKGYLKGIPTGVLSGGQYDKLLQEFGRSGGAIGFAVYLDLLERLEEPEKEYDIDILLLHNRDDNPAALISAAEQLSKEGSVLVAEEEPAQLRWRRLVRFTEGGAVKC